MPQGKGTYGSKVGRPSKKAMGVKKKPAMPMKNKMANLRKKKKK